MTRRGFGLMLGVMISLATIYAVPYQRAFAHTFTGDESASFLALVEGMKVELELVRSNLSINATLAAEHAEHSTEHLTDDIIKEIAEKNERLGRDVPASLTDLQETLEGGGYTPGDIDTKISNVNDLLDETVTVRIERAQLTNSTVLALQLANMVDETLEHYNAAYGVEEDHDEEGSIDMTQENSMNASGTEGSSMNMTLGESAAASEESKTIVDVAHYQSAQAFAIRAQELFDSKLKAMAEANATQAVTDLDAGLRHLKQAIDAKEPHDNVDVIVHSEVHPNIQKAYNLQIIPEFPLPAVVVVSALGAIIAATRFRILRK